MAPWFRRCSTLLLAIALLAVGLPGGVGGTREASAAPAVPPEIAALLGSDVERQWSALAALRQDPEAARTALVQALEREEPLPERWRLIHRLIEFGTAEDVPLLLKLRENAQNPWERRIAEGAIRALYDPVAGGKEIRLPDLEAVVQDFSFIQTGPPKPVADGNRGKWMLTGWSLADYHRDGLPLDVIKRVGALRGKAFDTRAALADALEKRVHPRDWKDHGEQLLASVESIPPRARLDGLARVRLFNPLQRPLLLRIVLDAWYGRIEDPPGSVWVYMEPGVNRIVDVPVRPQGSLNHPEIRLDLRLVEINGSILPSYHKLYLPLQL